MLLRVRPADSIAGVCLENQKNKKPNNQKKSEPKTLVNCFNFSLPKSAFGKIISRFAGVCLENQKTNNQKKSDPLQNASEMLQLLVTSLYLEAFSVKSFRVLRGLRTQDVEKYSTKKTVRV